MKITAKGNIKQKGKTYIAVPSEGECIGCAFIKDNCESRPCSLSTRQVDGFTHKGHVIFVEKPSTKPQQSPTNAAKAAAILYHTYGIKTPEDALAIYNQWEQLSESEVESFIENAEWGIWQRFDSTPLPDVWELVHTLALTIDTCRKEIK